VTGEERAEFADGLRYQRLAKDLLRSMGIDLTWVTLTEQASVERRIDDTVVVVRQIERVGYARGYADAVATYDDVDDGPALPPLDVWEGLGCPRI
jgi:hypothetical protein